MNIISPYPIPAITVTDENDIKTQIIPDQKPKMESHES